MRESLSPKVCVLVLFQWLFLDQISFETKQKSKYKVDFNFNFILIEEKIFWKYPKFYGEDSGTNQNFIAHVRMYS